MLKLNNLVSDQKIFGEQAVWLYRTGPGLFVGHLLSAGVLAWLLWEAPPVREDLLLWYAGMSLVLFIRLIIFLLFRADPRRAERSVWWLRWFAVGAALSGVAWGYAGWHFFYPTLLFLFPMALVLGAQVALSVPTAGVYFPAHAIFNVLTITPFLVRNLLENDRLFLGQSFALLTLMTACLWFAYKQQATICESIRLRFANLDLLFQVTHENECVGQARHQAEEANAAKSRFLAAASHDLRQPLQALSLFIQALVEDCNARRLPTPSLVNKIESSSDSLRLLLDSLLDLSQSEAGELKANVQTVALQPLFDRIRREFYDQASAQGLRFRVIPTGYAARSDPAMLERILRNLVVNALRYTERGSILIGCRRRGEMLRIEVRDSGIGIPKAAQSEIFRDFYQLGNPERDRHKGLGLGLAIVNALARQLGHKVDVISAPGNGSIFAIELPAGDSQIEHAAPQASMPDRLNGCRVVVMDDDAQVRDGMLELLERWGCQVVCGENADEVIDAFRAHPMAIPAVILSDWRLRENRMGDDEARKLHAHFGQPIPTALITGDTTIALGGIEFPVIHKPIQGGRLRAQLDLLLPPQSDGTRFS